MDPTAPAPADAAPPALKHLVYWSLASRPLAPAALEELLTQARRANRAAGLTGLLIHHRGQFIQCLEGPPAAVDAAFARIHPDPRHWEVNLLLNQPIAARAFPTWAMACTEVGASAWLQLSTAQWYINRLEPHEATPGFALLERIWEACATDPSLRNDGTASSVDIQATAELPLPFPPPPPV